MHKTLHAPVRASGRLKLSGPGTRMRLGKHIDTSINEGRATQLQRTITVPKGQHISSQRFSMKNVKDRLPGSVGKLDLSKKVGGGLGKKLRL